MTTPSTRPFGPSTPGAINLISGQTNGAVAPETPANAVSYGQSLVGNTDGSYTVIGDTDPTRRRVLVRLGNQQG